RQGLSERQHAAESGGLSGAPLFIRATILLARLRRRLGKEIALIGVGGVDSAETALEKIRAGADLVQVYTGLVYCGPVLPSRILAGLDRLVTAQGARSICELRDSGGRDWADRPLP